MKNYIIKTLMVALPEQSITESIIITLPNNAIPVGMDIRPAEMPDCLFLHHLIPCDENGNPIEEVLIFSTYERAWLELYKLFGERSEEANLDVMDSVLEGVKLEIREEKAQQETKQEG